MTLRDAKNLDPFNPLRRKLIDFNPIKNKRKKQKK